MTEQREKQQRIEVIVSVIYNTLRLLLSAYTIGIISDYEELTLLQPRANRFFMRLRW